MGSKRASASRVTQLSVAERVARGKAARKSVPRSSHALFEPGAHRVGSPQRCRANQAKRKPAWQLRYGVVMVAQDVIDAACQTLAAVAADPVKIVLFGSRARGDAGPDSDFDFLVVERDPQDRHAEMVRLGRALRPLGMPFDVVVVSERYVEDWEGVEGSMVHAALTEGRVLHAAA